MTSIEIVFHVIENLFILLTLMTLLWMLSVQIRDASIIDIFWGPACALPAVLTLMRQETPSLRAYIMTGLVSLWALRLAFYLARRNLGQGEDYRYQRMREKKGRDDAFARWSLIHVFWMQSLIAWFVSLPVQLGQFGPDDFGVLAWIGAAIFVIGLLFETIGDWQLMAFKSDPANKGKLMTGGLWSFTRHPNYFGDAAVWTGLTLIALESPYGLWTILSPVVMGYFLVKISGKAMTERHMEKKYPEYAAYRNHVSGFFPMPPKNQ
jgi:steroid 5-alpha reductase family enzyme